MDPLRRRITADLRGVHLALNVFVATSLLWLVIRKWAGLNPIWAISAMLAPVRNSWLHVCEWGPQSMPAGLLVIVPDPPCAIDLTVSSESAGAPSRFGQWTSQLGGKDEVVRQLARDEIALNSWAFDDLNKQLKAHGQPTLERGDEIRLTFFEPEHPDGKSVERTVPFKLRAVFPMIPTTKKAHQASHHCGGFIRSLSFMVSFSPMKPLRRLPLLRC